MGAVFIYSLSCPETGRVRYIGKAKDVYLRVRGHIRDCKRGKTPVRVWVKSLLDRGLWPDPEILAKTTDEEWESVEREFIAKFRLSHPDLLNVADGGLPVYQTRGQRQCAARAATKARTATPQARALYQWKKDIGSHIGWLRRERPEGLEPFLEILRPVMRKYPEHCTAWIHLL